MLHLTYSDRCGSFPTQGSLSYVSRIQASVTCTGKNNTPAVDFPKGNLVGFTLKEIRKGYSKK